MTWKTKINGRIRSMNWKVLALRLLPIMVFLLLMTVVPGVGDPGGGSGNPGPGGG